MHGHDINASTCAIIRTARPEVGFTEKKLVHVFAHRQDHGSPPHMGQQRYHTPDQSVVEQ